MEPGKAWERLKETFLTIGKVEESSDAARYLVGKACYGLNPVRLRISVVSGAAPESAVLEIQGRGQDVTGVASRKMIDRLLLALG